MVPAFAILASMVSSLGGATRSIASDAIAASAAPTTAILVDKKLSRLLVTKYVNGKYEVIKSYHATLGKVKGDKETEGDNKTPEGIYTFKSVTSGKKLPAKFGEMAFYMNYPNTYDEFAGRTGNSIMLHATNAPDRLKESFDSEGCVVVDNREIAEIKPYIKLGLTPILIFSELLESDTAMMAPGQDTKVRGFFDHWIKAWESKSIEDYISYYHTDFAANGMNKTKWKEFKSALISRYSTISIGPESVHVYRHPKYSMITFTQNYQSKLKHGGWGHRSRGTKILYVAEEAGEPKIIAETYTTLMW